MCNNIDELINGNDKTAEYYQNAKSLWSEIDISDINFKKSIHRKQPNFERLCGGRSLGQEIMVCYGIMQYMQSNPQDIVSAKTVSDALINSNCSNEVKQKARDIANQYSL